MSGMLYAYKALTPAGELVSGRLEAASVAAVTARLQALGQFPVEAKPADAGQGAAAWLGREVRFARRASPRAAGLLTQELATLLQSGLPLDAALQVLIEIAEGRRLESVLRRVQARLRGGSSLADSLAAEPSTFPPLYVAMVRAGELGGSLKEVLARLAEYLARAAAVGDAVRSALVYPLILLATAGVSLVVILTVVLPQFAPLFAEAGADLPLPTRVVMALGDLVRDWWWLAVGVLLVAAVAASAAWREPAVRLRIDAIALRLPLWGELVRRTATARFARALGTLLAQGVALTPALAIARQTIANAVIAGAVARAAEAVKAGAGLARPLSETRVFPPLAMHLVRVGEEAGRLDAMLLRVADLYDRELQRLIDRLLALLVPVLTIGLGLVIAGIIGSILVAILSINRLAA